MGRVIVNYNFLMKEEKFSPVFVVLGVQTSGRIVGQPIGENIEVLNNNRKVWLSVSICDVAWIINQKWE